MAKEQRDREEMEEVRIELSVEEQEVRDRQKEQVGGGTAAMWWLSQENEQLNYTNLPEVLADFVIQSAFYSVLESMHTWTNNWLH